MTTVQWLDAAGKKEPLRATPGAYQIPTTFSGRHADRACH